ncbi:MAG TPA: hypothetical protein VJS17_04935, partial [Pyrinomonadaceae bacterium]|nr:hypothetical protein [Pyrinomonadaceae bacterium]
RCSHPDLNEKPVGVTLTVNGEITGTSTFSDHSWHNLTFELGPVGTILNCEIAISNVWTPSRDARELGIAVHRIWLE